MTEKTYEDGIYFNLPEAEYHELKRLSASGIKDILVSLPTYWANSAMNKNKVEPKFEPYHFTLGSAYHAAVFEREKFNSLYVSLPHKDDYPDAIRNDTAVKLELKAMGLAQTKAGENALERAWRLRSAGYDGEIFSIIESIAAKKIGDKIGIKSFDWRQIQIDLGQIDENPEIKAMLTGGASEVSILWTCPDSGIQMKARIDKLKPEYFIDMKTFQNSQRKPVERHLKSIYEYNRLYIQARIYQVAISMIKQLGLNIMDALTDEQVRETDSFPPMHDVLLVDEIVSRETPHKCWFFWREKGGIPNALMREAVFYSYPPGYKHQGIGGAANDEHGNVALLKADTDIKYAKGQYLQAMEVYGPDKTWYNPTMISSWDDDDLNDWFLNSKPDH